MSGKRGHPAGCGPAERPGEQLDGATIVIDLPWVQRVAREETERVRIRLGERGSDEEAAILRVMVGLLDHRRSVA
jgi:hypothetical protein